MVGNAHTRYTNRTLAASQCKVPNNPGASYPSILCLVQRAEDEHVGDGEGVADEVDAVAIGQLVLGDKEDAARTAFLNEDHVVDLAEIGGDDDTGADMLYEIKCKSALCKQFSCGNGSASHGGAPASVGCGR